MLAFTSFIVHLSRAWAVRLLCHGLCRGLLAAAAQEDEGEGGAVNALDSASAAGDVPEVTRKAHCSLSTGVRCL